MSLLQSTPTNDLIRDIVVVIALFSTVVITFYHVYNIIRKVASDSRWRLVTILSIFALICAILFNVILLCYSFTLWDGLLSCKWQLILVLYFYSLNKLSLYIFQIERLFFIFISSTYEFSKCKIWATRIFLCFMVVIMSITIPMYGDAKRENNQCWSNHAMWINITAVVFDISYLVTIWILLSRRLLMLLNATKKIQPMTLQIAHSDSPSPSTNEQSVTDFSDGIDKNSNNISEQNIKKKHSMKFSMSVPKVNINYESEIYIVLKKNSLLTMIQLLTTNLSIIISVVVGVATIWTSIDSVINSLCVILMFSCHSKQYFAICGCLHRHISNTWLLCCSCHCCCKVVRNDLSVDL